MENYVYFLREIIDKHKIYQFDKLKDNKEDLYDFLEHFSKETEKQYPRKIYKTLRYLIVDQMYYVLRDEKVPENIEHAVFIVAFHENTYYFMMEKVVPAREAELVKNNIRLLNSKDPEGVKELYIDALKDLNTELDFTFIDLKKRVENDIYFKFEYIDSQYSKMWVISIYHVE